MDETTTSTPITNTAAPAGAAPSVAPAAASGDSSAQAPSAGDASTPSVESAVLEAAARAKDAQPALAALSRERKDTMLRAMADALVARDTEIIEANARDIAEADATGIEAGLRDRLLLDSDRVAAIAQQLRDAASLPDPIGEVVRGGLLANGLELREVRVPLGVIGMIYEARPNVTVDAAGLSLKAGSAVVLRGGSAALHSNTALIAVLQDVLEEQGLPRDLVVGIDEHARAGADVLMRARGLVDVLIPRGGAGLIRRVVETAKVPVIETGTGTTHVFVDASADVEQAAAIVENSKTQRIGVCNALETLLVHRDAAEQALPEIASALAPHGVTLHADETAQGILSRAEGADSRPHPVVVPATEEDWETEYLSLDLAVRVVEDIDEAIAHIRRYSSGHTESILTRDLASQRLFTTAVDSAVVMVNAATRFSDGAEFGFGAEIGISTQKLHARGPMGLPEITSTKWIVIGEGHVRP
ncbi:glutamate-5-semialdehyde dehydrogenase [Brachybacterium endophyticum]|uniref:Gamma-glutamyl phosphate reductase n=1 Tax=Brachybacterium endophyticum TaxID=2182385 RepID=A0A2U2RI25_9MICO|nr:glutamate-5-semialdehyde dehydrogenase [Brachybacterium endophyticum]PWH05510.1 glutamate-5-semialdehyde dehydrogenase [Brachybacterium endophyticum]